MATQTRLRPRDFAKRARGPHPAEITILRRNLLKINPVGAADDSSEFLPPELMKEPPVACGLRLESPNFASLVPRLQRLDASFLRPTSRKKASEARSPGICPRQELRLQIRLRK